MLSGFTDWPPELAAHYRDAGYWRDEMLGEDVREWARGEPDRVAVLHDGLALTYGELDAWADRLAAGLSGRGLRPGDAVVLQLPNVPELLALSLALFRLGARPVYALPAHRHREIGQFVHLTGAAMLVVVDRHLGFDHREMARRVEVPEVVVVGDPEEFTALADIDADPVPLARPDPADVALFLLSGGTTGTPKLIPRTHRDYCYNVRRSAENAELDGRDVYLAALPVAHNYALACPGVLGTLHTGGRVVLAPVTGAGQAFDLIRHHQVTVTGLVPPMAMLWLEYAERSGEDLPSLRLVQVGGAKFGVEAARRFLTTFRARLQQSFGMAEGLLSQSHPEDPPEVLVTTQGRPISPADEVRVVDEAGAPVPTGEVGELWTRGPYTLRGYFREDAHNAEAFTEDGFFCSGDLVRLTGSGHLVVEGRVKDQINKGGDKVAVAELEDHLLAHPDIRECAVVGIADDLVGERIWAFVVPDAVPVDSASVTEFLRTRGVADFKVPDRVETVEALPLTPVGKVDREQLRRRADG